MLTLDDLKADKEICRRVQTGLIAWGLLDPKADGVFGKYTADAFTEWAVGSVLSDSQEELLLTKPSIAHFKVGTDLASRVVTKMLENGYFISRGRARFNIVYLEGCGKDGIPNSDQFDYWNDLRLVIEWQLNDYPKIIGSWAATSEPGQLTKPTPQGTAMIPLPSQNKAWQVGIHKAGRPTAHEALVQALSIQVLRSHHNPPLRTKSKPDTGIFGINQHHGWDAQRVKNNSAGCLVGQSISGHLQFMSLVKSDRRYKLNNLYVFYTTVLDGAKV